MAKDNNSDSGSRPSVVLVTRLSSLADVAIVIPALYPICRANPDVSFVMLTQPWFATMLVGSPGNLIIEAVDVRAEHKGIWSMWRLAGKLRKKWGIDAVADLHSVIRSWAVDLRLWFSGVRIARIDKGHGEKRARIKGKRHDQLRTTLERYRDVFAKLGLDLPPLDTFKSVLDNATLEPSALVPFKSEGERWIAVAPFSQHYAKEYPLERMKTVIDRLAALKDVHIFLLGGGKREKLGLRPIARQYPNVTSLAEVKHGFEDEFQLLTQCELMLSMDSANMHLASLVGIPVVSVWGPTHPHCGFLGYGQSLDNAVQRDDVECRPCSVYGRRRCRYRDYHCFEIDPDVVYQHVVKVLGL